MQRIARMLVACAAVAVLPGIAAADMVNPSFDSGLTGWTVLPAGSGQVVSSYGGATNVLELSADPGVTAAATQFTAPGAGTDELTFLAGGALSGSGADWADAIIEIACSYVDTAGAPQTEGLQIGQANAAWGPRSIALPNLSPAQPAQVTVSVANTGTDMTTRAYADDFAFVPEPASLLLLGLGGALLRQRR